MSRGYQRPENAISKADEFIKVGKPTRALDTLYDVIKSKKRNHNYSEKLIEQIMFKYLELCVDLKKSHVAKEGLFQYRNMCQATNVASLAAVVQGYLNMAEKRTDAAKQESVDSVEAIDDLDNPDTPEMILLSAVSGEDAQDRSDRKILMPWVKFLWESYCQCLELLRTNVRVERLYHDIAQQAFRFCLKYQRKTEFRKLCDKLRNHLDLVLKQSPSPLTINLNNADTQQMNLDTRLVQLDAAIQMELWQEAYKAIEDIHGLMILSKKVFQPKMMANYYQKLALVFWKCGNQLFHAAAIFKYFQLTREMKKNISAEELGKLASRVLGAILAVPIPSNHPEFDKFIETDRTPQEKMARLAVLLSLQSPPTRQSLIKDAARFGVVQSATQPLQDLYKYLEVEFHPLKLCNHVDSTLKVIQETDDMSALQQYLPSLREITLVRLLQQVAQVYQSICFSRLLGLAKFTDAFTLERIIVDCVRHNDMQITVDHRTRTVHFGSDMTGAQSYNAMEGPHLQDMPSEQIRQQLMQMLEVLDKSLKTIHPDKIKIDNNALRQKIVEAYHASKARDHVRILSRHKIIEDRKEYLEKLNIHREAEEQRKAAQALMEQQAAEEERLKAERDKRERERAQEQLREIQKEKIEEKIKQIAQTPIGDKVLKKMTEKELAELDAETIMIKQVEELENEKRQLVARLKAQEKKVDHLERAKRKEEIPVIKEAMKKDEEEDKIIWKDKEEERIKVAIADREEAVKTRDRLTRMKEDKNAFMEKLLKERREDFENLLSDFKKSVDTTRQKRLEERKEARKEERRQKWITEQEEERQRKADEKAKAEKEEKERLEQERKEREAEEFRKKKEALDAIEAKKRQKELEIEERLQKEREERERRPVDRPPSERRDDRGGPPERSTWRREGDRPDRRDDRRDERPGPDDWRRGDEDRGESRDRDRDDRDRGAWKPSGGGWRDRERRKNEDWAPRRRDEEGDRDRGFDRPERRDDRGFDRGGDRRPDEERSDWRRGDPRDRRDDRPERRDDPRDRRDDPRERRDDPRDDRRFDRGPPRRDDRDDRGGGSWRSAPRDDRRDDRGPPRRDDRGDDRRDDRFRRGGDRPERRDDRGGDRPERRDDRGGDREADNWRSGPRAMPPPKDERRDRPPRDGPPRDGPPRDGPPRDGPPRDGPPRDGPPRDGPPRDGPPRDGPPRDGPPRDDPPAKRSGGDQEPQDDGWSTVTKRK